MLTLARWSIDHRRSLVVLWITALAAAVAVMAGVGNNFVNNFSLPNTDSQRATDTLTQRFPAQAGDADQIVFHARSGKVTDGSVRSVVAPMLSRVSLLPSSKESSSPSVDFTSRYNSTDCPGTLKQKSQPRSSS